MSDSGSAGNFLTSTSSPSIAVDAYDMQVRNQDLEFFLVGLADPHTARDGLNHPAPQLHTRDSSLTPAALIYACLNNDQTRAETFRPLFKTILVHSLVVIADFFHDAGKPCERCREAAACNTAVATQIKDKVSLDLAEFEYFRHITYLENIVDGWKTKNLMTTLRHTAEKLRLNGHLNLDDFVGNKTVVATCLCIAQTLKSKKLNSEWVLGDFPFAENLVSRIASDHTSTSSSTVSNDNARTEEVSYYGELVGRAMNDKGEDGATTVNCEEHQCTQGDNCFHEEREEDNFIDCSAIWPLDGATTTVGNSKVLTRIPRTCSNKKALYNMKKHPQDDAIESASKRRRSKSHLT